MAYLTFRRHRLHISSHSMALPFRALTPPTHFFSLHLSCVGLPAAVHLSEAAPANDPMHTEVVHGQLKEQRDEKEFQIINNNEA